MDEEQFEDISAMKQQVKKIWVIFLDQTKETGSLYLTLKKVKRLRLVILNTLDTFLKKKVNNVFTLKTILIITFRSFQK